MFTENMMEQKELRWLKIKSFFVLLLVTGISNCNKHQIQKKETQKQEKVSSDKTERNPGYCSLKFFGQVWAPKGCIAKTFQSALCLGNCYSSAYIAKPAIFVKVCRPTKWQYKNLTTFCTDASGNGKLIKVTKIIRKITGCTCTKLYIRNSAL